MERKHFEVRSAYNAGLFHCDRPWAAISITTNGDFPALAEENRRGLLQLAFADTFANNLVFRRLVDQHRKREQKFRATR